MNSKPLKILIACGGTGGHLFPGIAISEAFMEADPKNNILFVTTQKTFEKTILEKSDFKQVQIIAESLKGRGLISVLKAIYKIPVGIFQAMYEIIKYRPDIVIGMGGYVSGPVLFAAWLLCIKTVIHEQNSFPGITNRILGKIVNKIFLSFENSRSFFSDKKTEITGNPVRKEIERINFLKKRDKENEKFTVLICGGSQGAHSINMGVVESLPYIENRDNVNFIHQTGKKDLEKIEESYKKYVSSACVSAFFMNMDEQYKKADLIICRSGATTIAEITAMGKGAIYIPYPFASDNHQHHNAKALQDKNAADLILDHLVTGEIIAGKINFYQKKRNLLREFEINAKKCGKPHAAKTVVKSCYNLILNNNLKNKNICI